MVANNPRRCWILVIIYVYMYANLKSTKMIACTVEPLNNGHFGTKCFWPNFIATLRLSSLRGTIESPWSCRDHRICPLYGG